MLVAWLLVQKSANHIPLHRQVRVFERDGLRLPKQTLCDWVMAASRRLRPIVDRLFGLIRAGPVMQLDDTPVRCQAGRGETHFTARIWTFVNPEVGGVVYRFTAGRTCDELKRHLEGFKGTLGGDGYRGNHAAADRVDGDIRHAGCWAHVIRKFRDAGKEDASVADLFCSDIKKLFDIEREASSRQLDARDHLALRQERSRTVLAAIIWRARRLRDHYSDAGDMAQAIGYLLNQRRALTHFLSDSRIPIDNNACERAIRPLAVGRRNWLFAGSMCGGRAAAVIYSLIESCKIAGVNPVDYLADTLVRVGDADERELLQLIPANWAPAAPELANGLAEPALA